MCGIIAYAGHRPAVPVVEEGLRRLEYRGYDSAGIAWMLEGAIHCVKASGKLVELEKKLAAMPATLASLAIGHTRWATHGAPTERNAHPHFAHDSSLAIVHNGIVENYQELKKELLAKGHSFTSDTDTEVLANLIAECRKTEPDILHAFADALKRAKGAWAVCMMCREDPEAIYAARLSAPLIFGAGTGENFMASDIPAFLPYTREVIFLDDLEIARFTKNSYAFFSLDKLEPLSKEKSLIQWDMNSARKDGFRHFMLKEIFEQPRVINDGLAGRINSNDVFLEEIAHLPVPSRLRIVACGTSSHSGLWAKSLFERWAAIPVEVEIASEYRYREAFLASPGEMALFISQSGETADTLAAMRITRQNGIMALGLCNVVGSSIAREADAAIFTQAGPEISVASTKAMCSQMLTLALMALYWSGKKNLLSSQERAEIIKNLYALPSFLDDNLPELRQKARQLAREYSTARNFFFLGRGQCFPLALEGALKLKELSYIHAEGYAAGEMKHGPIALIDQNFPTFAIALDDNLFQKVKSNIDEVKARGGKVIALFNPGATLDVQSPWVLPPFPGPLSGFAVLPALQLFSYEMADYLGNDVDQPRNLAKSVTVE